MRKTENSRFLFLKKNILIRVASHTIASPQKFFLVHILFVFVMCRIKNVSYTIEIHQK